jgi:hypothetical protein
VTDNFRVHDAGLFLSLTVVLPRLLAAQPWITERDVRDGKLHPGPLEAVAASQPEAPWLVIVNNPASWLKAVSLPLSL